MLFEAFFGALAPSSTPSAEALGPYVAALEAFRRVRGQFTAEIRAIPGSPNARVVLSGVSKTVLLDALGPTLFEIAVRRGVLVGLRERAGQTEILFSDVG